MAKEYIIETQISVICVCSLALLRHFWIYWINNHVGRRAPFRVQGRRRSLQNLPSASRYHPQERLHRHQRPPLQGQKSLLQTLIDFIPLLRSTLSSPNLFGYSLESSVWFICGCWFVVLFIYIFFVYRLWKFRLPKLESTVTLSVTLLELIFSLPRNLRILCPLLTTAMYACLLINIIFYIIFLSYCFLNSSSTCPKLLREHLTIKFS